MTRKQALTIAIQALSAAEQNTEAIAILRTLMEELPLVHWTDTSIRDAVEQFISEHGRAPTVSDFKKRGLPPHTIIRQRYGVTLQTWLAENYPTEKPSEEAICAALTEAFVRDYERILPRSADEYDAQRSPTSPCWYTVAVHYHTKRWRGLLEALGLPSYNGTAVPRESPHFAVRIYTHYDFRE